LKDKLLKIILVEEEPFPGSDEDSSERVKEDALSALVNLGYKNSLAKDVVEKVIEEADGDVILETLLKKALKRLAK